MTWNRTRLASFVAVKTVETMHAHVSELTHADKQESVDGVNAELESMLAEIRQDEISEQLTQAQAMFSDAPSAPDALVLKRRLARRASEARLLAQWLVAEAAGESADTCEAYRRASCMRVSVSEVESDLHNLCQQANLHMIPCETRHGKLVKQKSSPAQILALENLRHAHKIWVQTEFPENRKAG